jgi:hypothetical protein
MKNKEHVAYKKRIQIIRINHAPNMSPFQGWEYSNQPILLL